ncbi:hypothetical protein EZV62_022714 [Acer yangbiense]|uniref:Uncharacterized protein n=1 Tax=Acer yangbiense TaxID=1000413 RepID=A0A5C7GZJ1_9ROSI|nr:hypothetical protein EZV62_022714 [Acer yangbiense]
MDRVRFGVESPRGSKSVSNMTLQKKILTGNQRKTENVALPVPVPDLTDFMNDMFFGTVHNKDKKEYNLTGDDDQDVDFDDSTRSNSSRLTHEWLEEAKRMVASSPGRSESPTKLIGSPCRFATTKASLSSSSSFDHRRDPLSRSARRHRAVEGSFSGEIMTKSAKHSRNKSSASLDSSTPPSLEESPAAAVHKWFPDMLKPTPNPPPSSTSPPDQTAHVLPPRQSIQRKSRFQTDNTVPQPHPIPPPNSRRTFRTTPTSTQVLSPPKNYLTESGHTHRRSNSYSTLNEPLSPPKNLMESAHRRSISKSTCSLDYKVSRPKTNLSDCFNEDDATPDLGRDLNGFLKDQRIKIDKISNRELDFKAKIVLPAPSNSTSSMVAAICYAWLLENRNNKGSEEGDDRERYTVVPVMNVRRAKMWRHQQTAWLFNHLGLDATSLLFADEVDLESLIMAGKLSILVVGQDVLRTTAEVGSQCTILTDNYCEDAYDLLQTPMLKKLLLGLMQDERDSLFTEALKNNYGNAPNGLENREKLEHRVSERRHSNSISHNEAVKQNSIKNPVNDGRKGKNNKISPKIAVQATAAPAATQAVPDNSRGKNKFFLAKWFGFGSK